MPTLGTMQNITAKPRSACGNRNASNPHSGVMNEVIHRLVENRINPTVIVLRGSTRWDSRAAMTVLGDLRDTGDKDRRIRFAGS